MSHGCTGGSKDRQAGPRTPVWDLPRLSFTQRYIIDFITLFWDEYAH